MPVIRDDDRYLEPAGIAMAREQKARLESWENSARILDGTLQITERGPKDLRPQIPDEMRGILLHGMTNANRPAKTREEQIKDYRTSVSMGYLAKDAPCRVYVNGAMEIVEL